MNASCFIIIDKGGESVSFRRDVNVMNSDTKTTGISSSGDALLTPIRGAAIPWRNWYKTADYIRVIDACVAFGFNAFQYAPNILVNNETGTVEKRFPDQELAGIVAHMSQSNLKQRIVKFHTSEKLMPAALPAYFALVKEYIQLLKPYKVDAFYLLNEQRHITGSVDLTPYFAAIRSVTDTPLGIALEGWIEDRVILSRNLEVCDVIGMNIYPTMSFTGLNTEFNGELAWYVDMNGERYMDKIVSLKNRYNKPVYITETGIQARKGRLANPSMWEIESPIDEDVQDYYYQATLPVLVEQFSSIIEGFYIWEVEEKSTFNPMNRKAGRVLKEYLNK